jgi:hypothetical protein
MGNRELQQGREWSLAPSGSQYSQFEYSLQAAFSIKECSRSASAAYSAIRPPRRSMQQAEACTQTLAEGTHYESAECTILVPDGMPGAGTPELGWVLSRSLDCTRAEILTRPSFRSPGYGLYCRS